MGKITLFDCYEKNCGLAYITGMQALVRLLVEQARLDREGGINSRGLVSGYPGSPLGGLDLELTRNRKLLEAEGIIFQPAINEELAATAIWGSQHIHLYDKPEIDGVFGLWYGKGPGLDRALDAVRHANMGGVSKHGGMVLAVGDDATGKSSTVAYQSEQTFIAAGVPFFYPRSTHDIILMGLKAFALSRMAGCCVGMKIVVDTADTSSVIDLDTIRPPHFSDGHSLIKENIGPVHIGRHDPALIREDRLYNLRLPAVRKFQQIQNINIPLHPKPSKAKLGIIAVGKTLYEVNDALQSLGINDPAKSGIGLFSIVMPWPIDPKSLCDFASDYDEILVVEEKRPVVEDQMARAVVNMTDRGVITGKFAPDGTPLLPETGELTHAILMAAIHSRATAHGITTDLPHMTDASAPVLPSIATRTPWYCAGCPHNSSTKLPDGEVVGMGIGCHSISGFLTPDDITNFTQMGGEGAFWIGRSPFSRHNHSFQNVGDGTYAHSGYLGIRAAVASGVNMTFKILYNGAVAMTGGQAVEGGQTPWVMSRQLAAEGIVKIAIVTDTLDDLPKDAKWANNSQIYHRRDIIKVQQELKLIPGVTAIIYIQSCATELRRKRKRGIIADKLETIVINEKICEGCGDCAVKSNCVAVKPVMRPEGEKRQIDQSLCNKDMSCLAGFCPSFVTVRSRADTSTQLLNPRPPFPKNLKLPDPPASHDEICNIFIAGIGGTGVSTLSGILVMAARIDGIAGTAVNQTGLSQKNGGVTSQVRLKRNGSLANHMVRLPTYEATLLIGCDAVVAANDMALNLLNKVASRAIINDNIDPVGVAGVGIGSIVDMPIVMSRLGAVMDPARITRFTISSLANDLLGSTTSSAIIMLGWALQKGLIPLNIDAVQTALRLNGTAINDNLAALKWGRLLAHDPNQLFACVGTTDDCDQDTAVLKNPEDAIAYFTAQLTIYQNTTYAAHFKTVITKFLSQIDHYKIDRNTIGIKAARALYRAMAIKDEYEVARLLTEAAFTAKLNSIGGDEPNLHYHLAPPILSCLKDSDGMPRKIRIGQWITPVLRGLASLSWLRESWIDPFGFSGHKRAEWAQRDTVINWIKALGNMASPGQQTDIEEVLDLMLQLRGYGHIKATNYAKLEPQIIALLDQLSKRPPPLDLAAE
ncbi:indolepyruvate ferredoxin oxidoreductase family protein [Candidatus Puniceispirillum sp.]|nr:indolepyruvate ferredoxin oxidoreductase family protein [Candidatus Puniceispirillum sp.]